MDRLDALLSCGGTFTVPSAAGWQTRQAYCGPFLDILRKLRREWIDDDKLCMLRQLKLNGKGAKKDPNKPGSNRRLNGQFRGMILERLSGKTLAEELAARRAGVQDVHFLREVLHQASHRSTR